jgi:aspartyl-tRNA(Asn)/glutamyl-tRNA(Gln) amidotransferase subunit A
MAAETPQTIAEAGAALRSGTLTAVELTTRMLDRVNASNERLGAFVTVCDGTALVAAAAADEAFAAGVDHSPLQGIPLAIKDIIATADAPTTANSRVLDPAWGQGVDAPVTARLREAGAVLVGKSTTSEFAIGAPDPTKGFPIPRNPWDTERTPAGSSSGTGIAVAAGLALGGLGTDTGGSVRGPASANGHTGLKVTFGRVPKNGVVPLGYSLDSVGPMARSAEDCALLLEVMAGYDAGDPCVAVAGVPAYSTQLTGSADGVRIGLPMSYFFDTDGLDDEVRSAVLDAVGLLGGEGAVVSHTVVPHAKEAKDATFVTIVAEAFAYHRNNLVERWETFGSFTRPQLARAALYTGADFAQAQRFRSYFRREVAKVFADVDVLITPTSPVPAEKIDEMDMDRRLLGPNFTCHWNLAGLPALAVPCGFSSSGLPLSMQIIGKPFAEGTVLALADAYQRITDWHLEVPPTPVPELVSA